MTPFGAPQQLYPGHIICTHTPPVLQLTLRLLSLTTRSKAQVSPGHPQGRHCLDSAQGSASSFKPGKRSSGSGQERSRGQDSVWAPCLPLNTYHPQLPAPAHSHGQDPTAENRHKVLLDENPIFQMNFKANASYSLSAEGARQFQICWRSQRWGCCTWCLQLSVRKVLAL